MFSSFGALLIVIIIHEHVRIYVRYTFDACKIIKNIDKILRRLSYANHASCY